MTNDTTNRLILSIAHRPLPTELLDSLIEKTATKSKQLLAELEATTETDGIPEDSTSRPSRNLHVLVTGSPKITTPGKSFDDWETKWTPGENIFSNFIDQVGLQRFHRLPRDGEARLVGKLVDVKQNDFQVHLEDGTVKEQLRNELVWIAINVKQHFNLYASAPVTDAIILYPFDVEGEDNYADADTDDGMGRDMIASTIHDIFQKEWAEKEGPLNGVQISIQIVNP